MSEFSLVTLNILNDLSRWRKRRWLLVEQLAELEPDLIALQEVSLWRDSSNAHWLADRLNENFIETQPIYEVHLSPKTGRYQKKEGLAILSRLPVKRCEVLDLLTQNRIAQLVELRLDGQSMILINSHFYWQPGESPSRQAQIELLLDWLDTQPAEIPVIVCGDFNGVPGTPAIEKLREYFDSAHNVIHGCEPEYTAPTPLSPSVWVKLRVFVRFLLGRRPPPSSTWRGTLDYIFIDPRIQIRDCQIVLNRPASQDLTLYPSGHFGLMASYEILS